MQHKNGEEDLDDPRRVLPNDAGVSSGVVLVRFDIGERCALEDELEEDHDLQLQSVVETTSLRSQATHLVRVRSDLGDRVFEILHITLMRNTNSMSGAGALEAHLVVRREDLDRSSRREPSRSSPDSHE